jgi:hypothetical protein
MRWMVYAVRLRNLYAIADEAGRPAAVSTCSKQAGRPKPCRRALSG